MKFKRVARRLTAVMMLVCICTGLVGGIVYGASSDKSASGYDSGLDYTKYTLKQLSNWYVGDFQIFTNLANPDKITIFDWSRTNTSTEHGDVVTGYSPFVGEGGNKGVDYRLYAGFVQFDGDAKCKLKEFIKEDGSGKLQSKAKRFDGFRNKDSTKVNMTPSNCSVYHPLNVLRMLQLYLVTRRDGKALYIGGWPVQVKKANSLSFSIQGARTIKTVYKEFTGKKYEAPKNSTSDPVEGTNYAKDSLYDKLLNGKITVHEASKQLVTKLKSAGIKIWTFEEMCAQGNMTYEEYLSVCMRGELGVKVVYDKNSGFTSTGNLERVDYDPNAGEDQFSKENIVVTDDRFFKSLRNKSTKIGDMADYKQREIFYRTVFRYLEEYGIHFYSFNQADSEEGKQAGRKTIFNGKDPLYNDARYPMVGKKDDNDKTKGKEGEKNFKILNFDKDDKVASIIAEKLKSAYLDCKKLKSTKPTMYEVATEIISSMKTVCPEDELNKYFSTSESSAIGDALSELSKGSDLDAATLNKVKDKAAKLAKGLNGLNKIDDTYVVKFFLDLCAQSGSSGNNAVDIEYMKIVNILNRKNVKKGKQTLSDCFAMMYSLENIGKCGKEYTMTFKARDSSQINAILKYSNANMKRVSSYFKNDKGSGINDTIDSYRNPELESNKNALQHYSDYAECSTAIKVMGAKVYKTSTGYDGDSAYEKFRSAYKKWRNEQKTGKTKNVEGVQQQDGLLPYALTGDTQELRDKSKGYFSDKVNSPDGKNVLEGDYVKNDSKKQEKVWKWKIDTDEFNEMLKTNFWVQLTNGLLAIVGMLMFAAVFVFSSVYAFDVVSNGYFNVTHKITFGKWDYVDDRKENVKVFGKLCVAMYFSCVIWNGTAFKWAVTIMNIAYQALTTK